MMRYKRSFSRLFPLIVIFIFSVPNLARATEPYDYFAALIESFRSIQIGNERISQIDTGDNTSFFKALIIFNNQVEEAANYIKPFTASDDVIIRETAIAYQKLYRAVIENNLSFMSFAEKSLNEINETAEAQGAFLRKAAEYSSQNEELWRLILQVTPLASHALVNQTRTENGKLAFLTITDQERTKILEMLVSVFGEKVTKKLSGGQLPIPTAGALLYGFLSNKKWKTADSE